MTFKGIVYPKRSSHEVLASRLHWLFWLKHFVDVASSRQIGVLSLPDPWMPPYEQYGGMLSFSSVVFFFFTFEYLATMCLHWQFFTFV